MVSLETMGVAWISHIFCVDTVNGLTAIRSQRGIKHYSIALLYGQDSSHISNVATSCSQRHHNSSRPDHHISTCDI